MKLLIPFLAFILLSAGAAESARAAEDGASFSFASVASISTEAYRIDSPAPLEKYLAEPSDQVKLAKYLSLLPPLMKDRSQTLQLGNRGFEENNPLLGRRPSGARINGYFFVYALSLLAAYHLPEPLASSILDSVRFQEEIVVYENERLFDRKVSVDSAPIAFMFTILY
ncbi:MAG: hypothetical protein EPO39_00620 [Candidatus Manganitrophaceae bacterium]|nr:MAG: hypothetical protein EPO39_00620 [Candidatus Manganitrophaceae bacterium]